MRYQYNHSNYFDDTFLAQMIIGDWSVAGALTGYMPDGQLTVVRTGSGKDGNGRPIDYNNFQALRNAQIGAGLQISASILANAASTPFSVNGTTATADSISALVNPTSTISIGGVNMNFGNMIDRYYQRTDDDFADAGLTMTANDYRTSVAGYAAPSNWANQLFTNGSNNSNQMIIFGAGDYNVSDSPFTPLTATFENLAPKLYPGLEHLFMTAVAVGAQNGTGTYNNVTTYNPATSHASNKITLSSYTNNATNESFASRACGVVAGRGTGSIDPWCFAAPGLTSDQAVAALAGSVGTLQSAFGFSQGTSVGMTMRQLFTLLAVTSDRLSLSADELKNKYLLPADYQTRVNNGDDYKTVFAEVFGYGLPNLQRATLPGSKVYVFQISGAIDKLISSNGNACWSESGAVCAPRAAVPVNSAMIARTAILPSSAFGAKLNGITMPMFDMVQSLDGELSMPRIFTQSLEFQNIRGSLDLLENFRSFGNDELITALDSGGVRLAFRNGYDEIENQNNMREVALMLDGDKSFASIGYKANARGLSNDTAFNSKDAIGVMGLASDNVHSTAGLKYGKFKIGLGGFMGNVKVSDNLAHDMDAISPNLGKIYGYNMVAGMDMDKVSFGVAAGQAVETDTILGAYGAGLMEMGGSTTQFIRANSAWNIMDDIRLSMSAEIARTNPMQATNFMMSEVSSFTSTAAAAQLDLGKLSVGASLPLAVIDGHVKYLDVRMENVEASHGYDLLVNSSDRTINMANTEREVRLNMAYRMDLGQFTNANVGAIYRINPDNSSQFGNESILMFKLRHKLGI
jgi:hypothetical protein